MADKTTSVGAISLDLVLNGKGFTRELSQLQNKAQKTSDKISSSFKKIGMTIGAALSVKMLTSFGKSCIDLGSDLSEVQNVVDVTFKTMNKDINAWAKNAASTFGLSETMAKKFTGLYGSMAEAFGFTEKQAYDMSTTLAGLAGDVASFYNIDQELAYTKLKSVFSGETETLKDLGIVMTENALDSFAMQQGIGKTVKQMTESEKVMLRYKFVLSQLNNASGDFAKTQDSWANQTRILKLRFDSLKATVGQGLIAAFSPALKVVNTLIGRLDTLAQRFTGTISGIFGIDTGAADSINAISAAEKELKINMDDSAAAVDAVTDGIEKSAKAANNSVASFDKLNLLSKNDSADKQSSAQSANPASMASVIPNAFSNQMGKVADKISTAWKRRGEKIVGSVKTTLGKIKSAVSKVGDSWRRVWNNGSGNRLLDHTTSLLSNIFGIIGDIAGAFTNAWTKAGLGDQIVQSIYDKWDSLISLLDTIASDFREVWNDGTGERIWGNILTVIKNCNRYTALWREKLKKAWENNGNGKRIWQTILGIVEDITGFLAEMSEIRLEWLEDLDLNPIVEAVANLGKGFRKLLQACGNQFKVVYKEVFLPLAKWTIEKGAPKVLEALAKVMKFFAGVIKSIPKGLLKGIAAGILAIVAASKAAKIISRVSRWIKALKVAKDAGGWVGVLKKAFRGLNLNPYIIAIGAFVAAAAALSEAVEKYRTERWNNSSLKEEMDKINDYSDDLKEHADNMKSTLEDINKQHIEVKTDVSEVESLKERLKKIIEDGVISKDEIPEYKTVKGMLDEVDGFKTAWSELDLSEDKQGNIIINDNIDDVNRKLDEVWEKFQKTQYLNVLSSSNTELYKTLAENSSNVEKAKENKKQAEKAFKKAFLDYMGSFTGSEGWEAAQITNAINKAGGYDAFINQTLKSGKLNFGGKEVQETLKSYVDADNALTEYVETQGKAQQAYNSSWQAMKLLKGDTDNYVGALYMVESGLIDEQSAFKMLEGTGVDTMNELQLYAGLQRREQEQTADSAQKSAEETKKASAGTRNQITSDSEKNRKSVKGVGSSAESASQVFKKGSGKIGDASSELSQNIQNDFDTLPEFMKGLFRSLPEKAKEGLQQSEENLYRKLETMKEKIQYAMQSLFPIKDGKINIAGFSFDASSLKIGANKIPFMASGRIVKGPTLAVVGDNPGAGSGDPEVVAPLSKLRTMMGPSSTGNDTAVLSEMLSYMKRLYETFYVFSKNGGSSYEFVANVNGTEMFKAMVDQNDLYKKRHGHSAFS